MARIMLKSQLNFQKNITYLKPKYYWSLLATWNIGAILVLILLNNENFYISLSGLVFAAFILIPLARFSFKLSTDKEFQKVVLKPEKLDAFNYNFFFFTGFLLSIFAVVAISVLIVRVAI